MIDSVSAEKMAAATSRKLDAIYEELRNKGQSYLSYLTRVAQNRGIEVSQVTRQGIPHREIADLARQCKADLIVMGQGGVSGPHRLDIGSVSKRVIESSPCPVLVAKHSQPRR